MEHNWGNCLQAIKYYVMDRFGPCPGKDHIKALPTCSVDDFYLSLANMDFGPHGKNGCRSCQRNYFTFENCFG